MLNVANSRLKQLEKAFMADFVRQYGAAIGKKVRASVDVTLTILPPSFLPLLRLINGRNVSIILM